jgi:hypothetical protein
MLKDTIEKIFVNESEMVMSLLKRYHLSEIIEKHVVFVSKKLEHLESENLNIGSLSSLILDDVNKIIADVSDSMDKGNLEYIISDIYFHFLILYVKNSLRPIEEIINDLDTSLKNTCELKGYEYSELRKLLRLERLVSFAVSIKSTGSLLTKTNVFYYDWKGLDYNLEDLGDNLVSEKVINSKKEFKQLFQEHNGELLVHFNRKYLDFVIILFDYLYEKGFITPKGRKGQFNPIKVYGVDFEEKVLIEKHSKHLKSTIKKNSSKYRQIKGKIEKWVEYYNLKS